MTKGLSIAMSESEVKGRRKARKQRKEKMDKNEVRDERSVNGLPEAMACEVIAVDDACDVVTKASCFECGNVACVQCSERRRWKGKGKRRICNDCILQEFKESNDDAGDEDLSDDVTTGVSTPSKPGVSLLDFDWELKTLKRLALKLKVFQECKGSCAACWGTSYDSQGMPGACKLCKGTGEMDIKDFLTEGERTVAVTIGDWLGSDEQDDVFVVLVNVIQEMEDGK